ncbi:MAG: type IV pilus modification PilV family protein [Actinomycetota bacterium]
MKLRDRLRASDGGDDGFGLVELLFSLVVFTIIASAAAYGLISATETSGQNRNRVQAANLVSRELEIVRERFQNADIDGPSAITAEGTITNPNPLPGQTAGNPLTIDNLPFTITREIQWLVAGSGKSSCDGTGAANYPIMKVRVSATWPRMGNVQPVESSTLLTPNKQRVDGNDAYLAIKVLGSGGTGQSGMTVTVANGSTTFTGSTDTDGCATFQVPATTTATAWNATVSRADYVTNTYTPTGTGSLSVVSGQLASTSISYDRAATFTVNVVPRSGYALPQTTLPVTLYSSTFVGGTRVFPGATPSGGTQSTVVGNLWPGPGGYIGWSGSCLQSDPTNAGGGAQTATQISPGGTAAVTRTLPGLTATVRDSLSAAVAGVTVQAFPVTTTSCQAGESPITLGVTDVNGQLRVALPLGQWRIEAVGRTPASSWPLTTMSATSTTRSTTVQVN